MPQGTIRKLVRLCSGTDFPSTHLVAAHNGVGYGYITSPAGDVFFDDAAIKNFHFDQLAQGMQVEYELDKGIYLRSSTVTVTDDKKDAGRSSAKMFRQSAIAEAGNMRTASDDKCDAFDESSIESFPASDSPARRSATSSTHLKPGEWST